MNPALESSFPPTRSTWIADSLRNGPDGAAEVRGHVMSVYSGPLLACARAMRIRGLGEPVDLVHGFFADRLGNPGYLVRWRESGFSLRKWLANGLLFYVLERRRAEKRFHHVENLPESLYEGGLPEQVLDREFARSVVRFALERAGERCQHEGHGDHWRVFLRHEMDDVPLEQAGREHGVPAERAAVMVRLAKSRFRAELREALRRDAASNERVDRLIVELIQSCHG